MIKNRKGEIIVTNKKQNKLLKLLYGSVGGRIMLKLLTAPALSRAAGRFMDSRLSKPLIKRFIRSSGIDTSQYVMYNFPSYNAFFTRSVKPEMRPVDMYKDSLKMTHIELASVDAEPEKKGGRPKTEHTVISSTIYVPTLYKGNLAGLSQLRLDIDDGFIVTDSFNRTSMKKVYAVGGITGQCQMPHEGRIQAKMLVENIVAEDEEKPRRMMDVYQMPHFIHTFPEVASIGLTTQEASVEHDDIKVGLAPLGDEPGSLFKTDKQGFVKVIVDGKYHEILGVHIIGENACELIPRIGGGAGFRRTVQAAHCQTGPRMPGVLRNPFVQNTH